MSSIKEVAKRANVSITTVSRYFHDPERVRPKTRARISAVIDAIGYAPNSLAQSFRLGRTNLILVMSMAPGDPFVGDLITGVVNVAQTADYTVRVQRSAIDRADDYDFTRLVASRQVDGIIITHYAGEINEKTRELARSTQLPIVACGETDPALSVFPRFQVNGYQATSEITKYLIDLGHRQIAFLAGNSPALSLTERESGFRSAMAERGLEVDPLLVANGALSIEGARRGVSEILTSSVRPTAIVCATDEMAFGAIAELRARGLSVPEDISVTGFDDTRYAAVFDPPLTTIAQPARELGERAMHCVLRILDGKGTASRVEYLPHQLVIRKSASPLRAA